MSVINKEYDVLVVGAGVAGIHAAYAAAENQATVLLLTSSWDTVATLAWGPSWSGVNGEKQRALPGFPGKALAKSVISAGSRSNLIDSFKYQGLWKHRLEKTAGVTIFQDTCETLERAKRGWTAQAGWGASFRAKTAILAIGPFLGWGKGKNSSRGTEGRPGEAGAERLRESIAALKIEVREDECRAAPTVAAHSISWERVRHRDGGKTAGPAGTICWTEAANGARIELEPTSVACDEVYLRGWEAVSEAGARKEGGKAIKTMAGLEKAHITRPAHSVSYVTVFRELLPDGLFFAGRFSGAKSYGESAEQGLKAGAAAASVSRET